MNNLESILDTLPFLRHCSPGELEILTTIGKETAINSGRSIELKKLNSLNIVTGGLFEAEIAGKNEFVYLTPGSYFGEIPFSTHSSRGNLKALSDSTLISFGLEDMYHFFLRSYKALRGYVKIARRMGLEMNDLAGQYLSHNSRVITVYSHQSPSGKSLFSCLMGLSLAPKGKTIILDLSHEGRSPFDYFNRRMTPALSQKQQETATELFIKERIEPVTENLDLLNVAFGSHIKVHPGILSPVLCILARHYPYILLDLSDADPDLRDSAFELTDILFALIKKSREREEIYPLFDEKLRDFQRVYYVLNTFYAGETRSLEGGYLFERFDMGEGSDPAAVLTNQAERKQLAELTEIATAPKLSLMAQEGYPECLFMAGALAALKGKGEQIDSIYSSSFSYPLSCLSVLSGDSDDFIRLCRQHCSEERLNNLLDITFPEDHVFKNSRLIKYAEEIAKGRRIEFFRTLPLLMSLENGKQRRVFCTGHFRDLIAISLSLYPLFPPYTLHGKEFTSGFPSMDSRIEEIMRSSTNSVLQIKTRKKGGGDFTRSKLNPFYFKYIRHFIQEQPRRSQQEQLADKVIYVDLDEKTQDIEKIIEISRRSAEKYI